MAFPSLEEGIRGAKGFPLEEAGLGGRLFEVFAEIDDTFSTVAAEISRGKGSVFDHLGPEKKEAFRRGRKTRAEGRLISGRAERIRTSDFLGPIEARCQTALQPERKPE